MTTVDTDGTGPDTLLGPPPGRAWVLSVVATGLALAVALTVLVLVVAHQGQPPELRPPALVVRAGTDTPAVPVVPSPSGSSS